MAIEVEATQISGTPEAYFGVLCRLQDQSNFCYLVIRGDGYFTIGKFVDTRFSSLLPEGWTFNGAIQTGNEINRLREECIGERLRLSVNSEQLGEVRDSDFSSGKIGIAAAALDEQGMEVHFDNLTVWEP